MLKAQQLGITPEQMIGEMIRNIRLISQALTSAMTTITRAQRRESPVVRTYLLSSERKRFIKNRTISQLYDPEKGMFLRTVL